MMRPIRHIAASPPSAGWRACCGPRSGCMDTRRSCVAAGTLTGPTLHTVALVESHGLDGEVTAPDGHVEVTVVVAPAAGGAFTVVNASSPVEQDCPIEVLEGA